MARLWVLLLLLPGCVDPWTSDMYDCRGASWAMRGAIAGLYDAMPPPPGELKYDGHSGSSWEQDGYTYTWNWVAEGAAATGEAIPKVPQPAAPWRHDVLAAALWLAPSDSGTGFPTGFELQAQGGEVFVRASYPAGTTESEVREDLASFMAAATDTQPRDGLLQEPYPPMREDPDPHVFNRQFERVEASRSTWVVEIETERIHVGDDLSRARHEAEDGIVTVDDWRFLVRPHVLDVATGGSVRVELWVNSFDDAGGGVWGRDHEKEALVAAVERVLQDHGVDADVGSMEEGYWPFRGCDFQPRGPAT